MVEARNKKIGVIVKLNLDNVGEAVLLVKELRPYVSGFMIGMELLAAMLKSAIPSYLCEEAALAELGRIRHLFSLLGCDALTALQFVGKAKGNGCYGIVFIPQGRLILIDKEGEKLGILHMSNKVTKANTGGYYVLIGPEITRASDPVAAAQKAASENKRTTRDEILWA